MNIEQLSEVEMEVLNIYQVAWAWYLETLLYIDKAFHQTYQVFIYWSCEGYWHLHPYKSSVVHSLYISCFLEASIKNAC